ncbi:hypothetical protein T10_10708 [Trichinella papuae]|uniref:Uncharacterized protein n=1 Tax=Trichinella papuae TaxID=268474 RepID=A0A0V1LZ75_9BILA|nr:hypothetical protein T10_10708 [Trichinella papuae]
MLTAVVATDQPSETHEEGGCGIFQWHGPEPEHSGSQPS